MLSSVFCESSFTFFITEEYTVYSCGSNSHSRIGHNIKEKTISSPKQIPSLINIKMISSGSTHTLCINYNGEVFSFGKNGSGMLGIGNNIVYTHIPQKIDIEPIKQVSCSKFSSKCLSYDGLIYTFGNNINATLGIRDVDDLYIPEKINDIDEVEYIVCGGYNVLCKTINDNFYVWGNGNTGRLGNGTLRKRYTPMLITNWPDDIISVKCGENHTLLLTAYGKVYSFGSNYNGQLGINEEHLQEKSIPSLVPLPEIKRIECGVYHSFCIDIDNNLWVFGANYYGQLGLGDVNKRIEPKKHPTLTDIIDISTGDHTLVKTSDNKIFAFGNNYYSQIPNTTTKSCKTPIQILEDKEYLWPILYNNSRQKSARK